MRHQGTTWIIGLALMLAAGPAAFGAGADTGSGLAEIGSRTQLFVDDYMIQHLSNAKQVLNPAQKHPNNPLIVSDRPWEGHYLGLSRVYYDEEEGVFKMWYRSNNDFKVKKGASITDYKWTDEGVVREKVWSAESYSFVGNSNGDVWLTCFATSRDGVIWEKPSLGKVEFNGSTRNNILPEESRVPTFRDPNATDPAKRYVSLGHRRGSPGNPGFMLDLYHSPDGFNWTPYENNPVIDTSPVPGRWGPTVFMGWDPIRKVYAAHIESCIHRACLLGKRLIGRAESPDLIHWSRDQLIVLPDEHDSPDTEFYAMAAFDYDGIYLSIIEIFRTTKTWHYPELAMSRDGLHYERNYREPFIRLGDFGDFDESTVYVFQAPIVHKDKVLVYYYGGNWRGADALHEKGDKGIFAIGLATVPRDGFVSVDAGKLHPGRLVTRPFSFQGDGLYVTMEAAKHNWGSGIPELRVEILDSNQRPVPGFTMEDSDPIRTTGRHRMSWQGRKDVGGLEGTPVQLRFHFKNAKLFSFQFQP